MTRIKFCFKCQIETNRSERGRCMRCAALYSSAYRATNPEKVKATIKSWVSENPERAREAYRASAAAWRAENLERARSSSAAWVIANPDRKKKSDAMWRAANKDRVRANHAEWYAANPDALRIYSQNRRSRERSNGGVLSIGITQKLFKLQKGKCPCCGKALGVNYHLDHKMPIALGGDNSDSNVQLLRKTCNLEKHAKHPIEFMQSRGFLL